MSSLRTSLPPPIRAQYLARAGFRFFCALFATLRAGDAFAFALPSPETLRQCTRLHSSPLRSLARSVSPCPYTLLPIPITLDGSTVQPCVMHKSFVLALTPSRQFSHFFADCLCPCLSTSVFVRDAPARLSTLALTLDREA